jgi:hypothetical protein
VKRTFTMLRRNPEIGARCREIIGLTHDGWAGIDIQFGTDNPAVVTVQLLLEHDQIVELLSLAYVEIENDCVVDTSLENNVDELQHAAYRESRFPAE